MNTDLMNLQLWMEMFRPWFEIVIILLLAWLALRLMRRALGALQAYIAGRTDQSRDFRRIETLMSVFRYTANIVIVGLTIMLALGAIGISIAPLLATAGIAGVAIGFGAQSLVKDFFTGLFLLLENQVSEGDFIEAAAKSGYVERVTLRHIRIRDDQGSVHFIPNSMVTAITNRSREYSYAVINFDIPRKNDLDPILALMRSIVTDMRGETGLTTMILSDMEVDGVEGFTESTVALRGRIKVRPGRQWQVKREFLLRMKNVESSMEQVKSAT